EDAFVVLGVALPRVADGPVDMNAILLADMLGRHVAAVDGERGDELEQRRAQRIQREVARLEAHLGDAAQQVREHGQLAREVKRQDLALALAYDLVVRALLGRERAVRALEIALARAVHEE